MPPWFSTKCLRTISCTFGRSSAVKVSDRLMIFRPQPPTAAIATLVGKNNLVFTNTNGSNFGGRISRNSSLGHGLVFCLMLLLPIMTLSRSAMSMQGRTPPTLVRILDWPSLAGRAVGHSVDGGSRSTKYLPDEIDGVRSTGSTNDHVAHVGASRQQI